MEKLNNSNMKNKKLFKGILMGVLIGLLVGTVGAVTYAFFNYTRTGNNNTVQAGRIYFNSTEDNTINLENAFPISSTDAETDTTNAKTLQITVTGDTSYSRGLEYLVTATDVHMTTTTGKTVPVTIEVSVTGNNSKTLGTSDDEYYTNRGGNTSMYKIEYDGDLNENDHILVGYISPDTTETGVDGLINIKAYFNDADILISDTYNDGNPPTDEKGTPASLGEGKTVLTTSEWNSLTGANALSFKIKVEAREGIWVEEPLMSLGETIISRLGNDGVVAINTSGVLASGSDTIREYRYSGGGRYCSYENGGKTYNLQIEGNECSETVVFGGEMPGLYTSTSDYAAYNSGNAPTGTTYTLVSETGVQEGTVKNYLSFNNELWRIIGVFGNKVKIMQNVPIKTSDSFMTDSGTGVQYTALNNTNYMIKPNFGSSPYANTKYATIVWNSDSSNTKNNWAEAGVQYWLNENNMGSYYNTINSTYKNLIVDDTYYLGNVGTWGTVSSVYNEERATAQECAASITGNSYSNSCNVWNGNSSEWTGKIALPYPSDFGYAASSSYWTSTLNDYSNASNRATIQGDNWFLNNDAYRNWFLSPSSITPQSGTEWSGTGFVGFSDAISIRAVRPVLNLKSDTVVYSGDGSYNDPYKLVAE